MCICCCSISNSVESRQSWIEFFHDLRRRSKCGANFFGGGADAESKNETPSISATRVPPYAVGKDEHGRGVQTGLFWVRSNPVLRILNPNPLQIRLQPKFLASANFLTCYCFSVILLLRIKKQSLPISFLMCVVQIETFWLRQVSTTSYNTGITLTLKNFRT